MECYPPLAPLKTLAATYDVSVELGVGDGPPINLGMIKGAPVKASTTNL